MASAPGTHYAVDPGGEGSGCGTNKLECRLSKGEKRNRKRLADGRSRLRTDSLVRSPADVLASQARRGLAASAEAKSKWVTASVVEDAAVVIAKDFDEAERRDPNHSRRWVARLTATITRSDRIEKEATAERSRRHDRVDFIHVLEVPLGSSVVLLRRRHRSEAWCA